MSSGKINLFFPPTEKQPNTLSSDHSAVTTASVSAAPSTLIHCKEEEKMEEDGGSLSQALGAILLIFRLIRWKRPIHREKRRIICYQ
jgi:hypothetical protein